MRSLFNPPLLSHIENVVQTLWLNRTDKSSQVPRLFIATSGYEARNIYWISKSIKQFPPSPLNRYLVIGFKDYADALSRPKNDDFYKDCGLAMEAIDSRERDALVSLVTGQVVTLVDEAGKDGIEVHIDYSCMPRLWYCQLPVLLDRLLRSQDMAYFWYTPGEYPEAEYPTAGVEDFHVFSGKSSLRTALRTHVFGLGFDRIRSQAIWSVLDPQRLVCFYADPAAKPEYVNRVQSDNHEVLAVANHVFSVPIQDFIFTYSKIAATVSEFLTLGDVILVPDGPKPLILAASLVPLRLARTGVLCFHVTRRKTPDFKPIDVKPFGDDSFGFRFCGHPD